MLRRSIEISREAAHLAVEHGQLLILRPGQRKSDAPMHARFSCEDLGVVITSHREITYTHSALAAIAEAGGTLVVCGADHLPVGLLLPVSGHSEVASRLRDQLNAGTVLVKRLWTTIVVAKIRNQAANLDHNPRTRTELLALARTVASGDPKNHEAQAARLYWPNLFRGAVEPIDAPPFRRRAGERDAPPPNNLLDYGYGVVRAAVARAIVGAGLLPTLGMSHTNRANAFALADDLVEPVRPLVDRRVRELIGEDRFTLDQPTKAALIELLDTPVEDRAGVGPLIVVLARYAASLAQAFKSGEDADLDIPALWAKAPPKPALFDADDDDAPASEPDSGPSPPRPDERSGAEGENGEGGAG